ncbi:MAG: hydroxyacid dehydrogenase, partial [Opitutaceae bacterium]|nr:hydroxyacid dehydrogenase [Opitutaceae bacterium]
MPSSVLTRTGVSAPAARPSVAPSRPDSILAALTPTETADFLPEPLASEVRALAQRHMTYDPLGQSADAFHRALREADPEILVAAWKTPALPAVLPPRLRYVCYLCGSVKKLITRDHLERGLIVTNWGGSISRIVAEWALFHILSCLRRATAWALAMHLEGGWKDGATETASLFGRTVGLHGFGQVARELVRLLAPFGVRISVLAPDVDAATEAAFGIYRSPSIDRLFSENDIIVELAPLIPETVGMVTEQHLRLIRPGGVFINVGRGAVVDEAALLRVAAEGKIQVGLDVFTQEPLPKDSGFRGLRNVTLTPHLAGPTTDR